MYNLHPVERTQVVVRKHVRLTSDYYITKMLGIYHHIEYDRLRRMTKFHCIILI
jgi:hypothetical protein